MIKVEQHKRIVKFMGPEYSNWSFDSGTSWLSIKNLKGHFEIVDAYEKIPYDKSWDYLMPVIEKISELVNVKMSKNIKKSTFEIKSEKINISIKGNNHIEVCYNGVLEFLKQNK